MVLESPSPLLIWKWSCFYDFYFFSLPNQSSVLICKHVTKKEHSNPWQVSHSCLFFCVYFFLLHINNFRDCQHQIHSKSWWNQTEMLQFLNHVWKIDQTKNSVQTTAMTRHSPFHYYISYCCFFINCSCIPAPFSHHPHKAL